MVGRDQISIVLAAKRLGVPVGFLNDFLRLMLNTMAEAGWPRSTRWMESVGFDLRSFDPATQQPLAATYIEKRIRSQWFWMQFFDDPREANRDFNSR